MIREVCNDGSAIFPYIARLPKEMKHGLPLIVLLHGAGERGDGSDSVIGEVEVHGFSKILTLDNEYDCVLIQPQCKNDSTWAAHVQEIGQFIKDMIKKYDIDESRVYLTGLSMGGFGTWYTAMEFPEMFAAIAPVCGGGMPWNAGMLSMPVWAFHGDKDDLVLPSNSIDMIKALRAQGRGDDVKFNLLEGVGHNAWDYAYNKELYDWLLSHKRA
ncbi:MAG: phospholipase [Clostridiales bacterium]|nr:phospholipase [Clostridiales bacterium]